MVTGTLKRALLALILVVPAAYAADGDVGTVKDAKGTIEVERDGAKSAAAVGAGVRMGDTVHAGADSSARVVFIDDTVLTISASSSITIDDMVYMAEDDAYTGGFNLLAGKVRSFVSENYKKPSSSFQIRTPTATAGVRGTDFAVAYSVGSEETEVVTFSGSVEVFSLADPENGILVGAGEMSMVAMGAAPTATRSLSEREFRQTLDGIDFGGGFGAGLSGGAASGASAEVGAEGESGGAEGGNSGGGTRDAGDILDGSPVSGSGSAGVKF